MSTSKKSIVQKYVILKIQSGDWRPGQKILSENVLSKKFSFSRLTVRLALQALVENGIITAVHGEGYFVSQNRTNMSLHALPNSVRPRIKYITDKKILKVMKDILKIDKNDRVIYLRKDWHDKKGIKICQYTALNKELIWEINDKKMTNSLTNFLASQGLAIKYTDIIWKPYSGGMNCFAKDMKDLGIKVNNLIEFLCSYAQEGWVEKTIRMQRPNEVKIKFRQARF